MPSGAEAIVGMESGKMDAYYAHVRYDIAPLLPATASQIMDVGCGEGKTAAWLKQRYAHAKVIGVEGNAALERQLKGSLDEAYIVDLNKGLPKVPGNDLILFLDVLEHLPNPQAVLDEAVTLLSDTGRIIVSVPNIANIWVSGSLFWQGAFEYTDSGILDRTHMRFFVRRSLEAMMQKAGLNVTGGMYSGMFRRRDRMLNALTGGVLASRFARQLVAVGRKTPTSDANAAKWVLCERTPRG